MLMVRFRGMNRGFTTLPRASGEDDFLSSTVLRGIRSTTFNLVNELHISSVNPAKRDQARQVHIRLLYFRTSASLTFHQWPPTSAPWPYGFVRACLVSIDTTVEACVRMRPSGYKVVSCYILRATAPQ